MHFLICYSLKEWISSKQIATSELGGSMACEAASLDSVKNGCHDIETISNLGITEKHKENCCLLGKPVYQSVKSLRKFQKLLQVKAVSLSVRISFILPESWHWISPHNYLYFRLFHCIQPICSTTLSRRWYLADLQWLDDLLEISR